MTIKKTEIESVHGEAKGQRLIFYRCQDHLEVWHSYGPVITTDPDFDVDGHKEAVAVKVAESLAEQEFNEVIG